MVKERNNIEDTCTTKGFSSWKKALHCFEEHEQTHVVIPKSKTWARWPTTI